MGKHVVKRKILNISFEEGSEHYGLEIRARSVSFGRLMQFADQAEQLREGAALSEMKGFINEFSEALDSWNAADEDGRDIPATREGLLSQDTSWVIDVLLAWFDSIVSVAGPLDSRSTSGGPSPEASIPMEPLSANHQN